ncbi:MAG: carboxylating nicotinate-nucleotide diphosphorylase [Candidatus Omnitrophota bacterium]
MQNFSPKKLILSALKEDAAFNDITSKTFIPKNSKSKAYLINKEPCVLCGINIFRQTFQMLDKNIKFTSKYKDGAILSNNTKVAFISGNTQKILSAERVALNFLTHLSGVATLTKKFVDAIKPYKTKIMDTRKTLPGLRTLEKYAVRCGGGFNHRISLKDQMLIKDNHLAAINKDWPTIHKVIKKARSKNIITELEVTNLNDFKKALEIKPDIIMLDNMNLKDIKTAVKLRNLNNVELEVSGNINLKNIREVAKTGVDRISIGALTHSAQAPDFSLEVN